MSAVNLPEARDLTAPAHCIQSLLSSVDYAIVPLSPAPSKDERQGFMTFPENDGGARRVQMAARARDAVGEKLGEIWWMFMLRGILAALLGFVALFWPTASLGLFLRVIGLFLLADAITSLVALLRGGDRGSGLIHIIISLGTGAALLFLPGTSARAAFTLLGIWALVTGLGYLWSTRQMDAQDSERSAARTLGGVTSLGGLALILWPGTGVVALAWAVAVVYVDCCRAPDLAGASTKEAQ